MIDVKNASNNGMNCLNGSYPLTLIIIKFVTRFIYNQLHIILNMENIETIAFRGSSDLIGNLQLCIDHISYAIPNIMNSVYVCLRKLKIN